MRPRRRGPGLTALITWLAVLAVPGAAAPGRAQIELPGLLDCARERSVTMLSAHRGGAGPGRPENSLAAMEASIAAGALFLEVDVAQTADGELVLMHDRTLDRTTTGAGPVVAQPLAMLETLRLVDVDGVVQDASPPTLAAAFDAARNRAFLQLDVKGVAPERLVAAIRAAGVADQVLVITYSVEDALRLHALAPELVLSVGIDAVAELDALLRAGLDSERIVAWLGLGAGDAPLDAALADRGVETSYADFRGERSAGWDYAAHAAAGAEILSVDDVEAAARALDAAAGREALLASCSVGS